MMEMTDGRMSLHGDSTCVVLRERVDFFTMWYSYGQQTEGQSVPATLWASGIGHIQILKTSAAFGVR